MPRILEALALCACIVGVYAGVWNAGFVWDDPDAIINNELLRGPGGLVAIWTQPERLPHLHYWPLTYTTFWLEYQLWGDAPRGYHLVNVALHCANTLLVWSLLRAVGAPAAWWAAALFALHPLRVESVAWVIERKDVLAALGYLAALRCFLRYEAGAYQQRRWLLASLGSFVAAMLSKSMAVTLPVAVTLWLCWNRRGTLRECVRLVVPFYLIAALLVGLELATLKALTVNESTLAWWERPLIAARALCHHAGKLLWPHPLMAIYPRWEVAAEWPWHAASVAALIGVVAALRRYRQTRLGRLTAYVLGYYAATLLPTLGFVDFGHMQHAYVADRYQYLASIGPTALLVGVVARAPARYRAVAVALGTATLVALSALTVQRVRAYRSLEALFRDTTSKNAGSWAAYGNLAIALNDQQRYGEALEPAQAALRLGGPNADLYVTLGTTLSGLRRYDEALELFARALELNERHGPAHFGMGLALANQGRFAEALRHFELAAERTPSDAEVQYNLGLTLGRMGRYPQAAAAFRLALRADPQHAKAHNNLGLVLNALGRPQEAKKHFLEALRLDPDYTSARRNLEQTP